MSISGWCEVQVKSEREYGGWMVDTWRKEHSKWIWWKWIWCSLGSVRISDESNKWKSGTQRWKWIWYLTKVTVEGESLKVFLDRPHWSDKNVHLNIFITYQATSKCGIGSHPKNLFKKLLLARIPKFARQQCCIYRFKTICDKKGLRFTYFLQIPDGGGGGGRTSSSLYVTRSLGPGIITILNMVITIIGMVIAIFNMEITIINMVITIITSTLVGLLPKSGRNLLS